MNNINNNNIIIIINYKNNTNIMNTKFIWSNSYKCYVHAP